MSKYNYKEEANKLKEKRNLPFKYIKYYSEMAEYYEEELSKQCETSKEYQDSINEILDKLENKTFKDEIELLINYQFEIQMYGHFGYYYKALTSVYSD